tara:strand:+ start:202 stop:534 length:333 start_codon:yes stop_codon:yes gene_type:complete
MLRASKVVLMDSTEYTDVELIPSDDGIVIINDSEIVQIMHHAISSIVYSDAGSQHYARGRALAMYYEEAERLRELLEEFDFELNEMQQFIADSLEADSEEKPTGGENPYA